MEFIFFLLLILPIGIALTAAYFISLFTRKKLEKAETKNVKLISTITFISSFLIIAFSILALIAYNIEISR
ncbi:hypothetical protein [Pedobacter frigiditerrae]|uniref:hypothetical protein n=1 Tax=Pedobacter frigiditerrae TaxID=2530452 RepID=UPI00292D6870|nr:hypothetical protein [Pedobacter frigiditerrae]